MHAIIVQEPGPAENMQLGELPKPKARPGHVVVQVEAAGINPVDAGNRSDPRWAAIDAPYVVGYELAGVVDHVGDGVSTLAAGERVWGFLPVRGTRWGTYAEFVEVSEGHLGRRPQRPNAVEAAAIPLAGSTALQLLDRLSLGEGESLLVHGAAGGVGSLLVQLAVMRGIRVAGSASKARHSFLRELGVEVLLDREHDDVVSVAMQRIGGQFDAVADLVGQGLLARSLTALEERGHAVSIVELSGDFEEGIDRNITIHGLLARPDKDTLDRLATAVENGSLRPIVDEVFEPDSIATAHRRLETGHGRGRTVLNLSGL